MLKSKPQFYFSSSLERGLKILSLFAENKTVLTQTEISQQLRLNKTSVFRFTNTLLQIGFLTKDPETKQLKIGINAFALSHGLLKNYDAVQIISPLVDETFENYNVTIDVVLIYGDSLLTVYRREARDTFIFHTPTVVHKSAWHYYAIGKIIMAALPRDEIIDFISKYPLIQKTEKTITKEKALIKELEITRERGYSLNNEEYIQGLISIGAPLVNLHANKIIGSISFDFSTIQNSAKMIEEQYSDIIKSLAAEISKRMFGL